MYFSMSYKIGDYYNALLDVGTTVYYDLYSKICVGIVP